MNKFSIIAKSFTITLSMIGIAYADNDSSLLNNWTGFYAGASAGVVFNDVELDSQQLGFTNLSEHCDRNSNYSTFSPGVQLGYMHQFPNRVVSGIEANAKFNTNQKEPLNCECPYYDDVADEFTFKNDMQTSIKGRIGRALNWNNRSLFPYLTAGVSFAELELTYTNEGGKDNYSDKTTQAGWLIGAGLEWAFRQNWSLRTEYSYVDYGNALNMKIPSIYGLEDPDGNASVDLSSNNIDVSVNYWF